MDNSPVLGYLSPMKSFPESAVHKTVPLKFSGVQLTFKTSHALFSSHHVDDGTMLLLKSLAQRAAVPKTGRVLDAGCGYGPLAVALKKFNPLLEVTARDRLALAARFTAENARINGVEIDAAEGLLFEGTPGPWDLVVSNVPAKAGEPVLADFLRRALAGLSPTGLAAFVIVEPLAAWFLSEFDRAGAPVEFQEAGGGYRVVHVRRPDESTVAGTPVFPDAYRRGEATWSVGPYTFVQKTFYGLPNFDGLDHRLSVTLPLLEGLKIRGETLVWEPVQGHLASWADAVLAPASELHLAGNDTLGLAAGVENVVRRAARVHAVPFLDDLDLGGGSLGAALVQVHSEPEVPWVEPTLQALLRLLAAGGVVVMNGRSTDLTRFLDHHQGLRKLRDERSKGWRAVLLERQSRS